ncbi:MAG: hypothetical protein II007_01695 [Gammaproteobacteria bacterium]|nr:hypothetical protein [Gammaproteobacteria bacterium]
MESIEALTQQIVPLLLAGEDSRLSALRAQYEASSVSFRAETNWGFFATFQVPQELPIVEPLNFCGGDANIQVTGVTNNAGCVLYVEGGRLSFLEVYTYDEPWPSPPKFGEISFVKPIIPGERVAPKDI